MTYPLIGNHGRLGGGRPVGAAVAAGPRRRPRDRRRPRRRAPDRDPAAVERRSRRSPGVDTRALARHLRETGCLRGIITAPGHDRPRRRRRRRRAPSPRWEDQDFVAQVSPAAIREVGDGDGPLVAIVDYGLKANIVRSLRRRGARVRVLPHTATAEQVLAGDVAGVVLSPGPGDPARLAGPVALARAIIDDGRPLLGICLGPPDRRPGGGRRDAAPALRAPRRQPPGPGPGHGPRPGHGPEPRGPGRRRHAARGVGLPGQPAQPQRRVGRGPAPRREADRDRPVPPRGLARAARRARGVRPLRRRLPARRVTRRRAGLSTGPPGRPFEPIAPSPRPC